MGESRFMPSTRRLTKICPVMIHTRMTHGGGAVARFAVVAVLAFAGACSSADFSSSTSSADTLPPVTTMSVGTVPSVTTAAPPRTTTTSSAASDLPLVAAGWSIVRGDLLVAGGDGVAVVREGAVVGHPITSPVTAAFADGSGGIVFLTPNGGQSADQGRSVWRAYPDGTSTLLVRSAPDDVESPSGLLTLYQVEDIYRVSDEDPIVHVTPLVVSDPATGPDLVWYAPNGQATRWRRPYLPEEGEITGIGWLAGLYPGGQLFVAIHSGADSWLERWTLYIGVSPWNNPLIRGTPCRDDPSRTDCLGTVTALPGTSLIAYTETNSEAFTYLVVLDTESGIEQRRLQVAAAPTVVTQLHASEFGIVVNLANVTGDEIGLLPAVLVDLESGAIVTVPIPGITTVVR